MANQVKFLVFNFNLNQELKYRSSLSDRFAEKEKNGAGCEPSLASQSFL
jgi:hypothetical protein